MLFRKLVHVLDPKPHSAPLNMAIDEVLLQRAGQPCLRVYRWEKPALSFGYFGALAAVQGMAAGRPVVRRWTGGGIVEHGDDVTYTLVVPRAHPFAAWPAAESYRLIHDAVGEILAQEGARVALSAGEEGGVGGACFANPVRFDLVASGRKIAGAAQRRTRWGLLHQGSIQADLALTNYAGKLAEAFGDQVEEEPLAPGIVSEASALAEAKYGSSDWLQKF